MPDTSRPAKEVWNLGGLSIKELGRRAIHEIQDDDCLGRAAQLAYYFLFALFPFFLVLVTLLGYLPLPNLLDRLMETLGEMLPGDALQLVQDNVRDLVTNERGGLLSFGILAALWTSSSAVTAIMDGLNRAYDVEEGRPFWKVRLFAVLLTVGLSLFIIVSLVLLTFGPQIGGWVADQVGLGGVFQTAWNLLRWPVIVGLLILAMALVYYVAPDVEQQWQWITPGSIVAVLGWLVASLGFSFYVNNFGSYNATYGSIGAVIVLLTWMYVSGFFVLVGGEINAEIEHASASGKDPGEKDLSTTLAYGLCLRLYALRALPRIQPRLNHSLSFSRRFSAPSPNTALLRRVGHRSHIERRLINCRSQDESLEGSNLNLKVYPMSPLCSRMNALALSVLAGTWPKGVRGSSRFESTPGLRL